MKIISNSSYRALLDYQRAHETLSKQYRTLEKKCENQSRNNEHLKSELNRLGDKVMELTRQLNKFKPLRGKGGRFTRKVN